MEEHNREGLKEIFHSLESNWRINHEWIRCIQVMLGLVDSSILLHIISRGDQCSISLRTATQYFLVKRNTVCASIKRLIDKNLIVCTRKGTGNKHPSLYTKNNQKIAELILEGRIECKRISSISQENYQKKHDKLKLSDELTGSKGIPLKGLSGSKGIPLENLSGSKGIPLENLSGSKGIPLKGLSGSKGILKRDNKEIIKERDTKKHLPPPPPIFLLWNEMLVKHKEQYPRSMINNSLTCTKSMLDNIRLLSDSMFPTEKEWISYFTEIFNSTYLRGEVNGFKLGLSWALKEDNAIEVMDGKYKNRSKKIDSNFIEEEKDNILLWVKRQKNFEELSETSKEFLRNEKGESLRNLPIEIINKKIVEHYKSKGE